MTSGSATSYLDDRSGRHLVEPPAEATIERHIY
jgi:hypothetical protein